MTRITHTQQGQARDGFALFTVGFLSLFVIGCVKAECLEQAYKAGEEYYQKEDYKAAFDKWNALVDRECACVDPQERSKECTDVENKLGIMYTQGWGTPRDYKQAKKCFGEAANKNCANDKNCTRAQNNLGVMYYYDQDYVKACEWFKKAAKQDLDTAQFHLGVMYYYGQEGILQNYTEAGKWFTQAAKRGLAAAQFYLGVMYEQGKGVEQNYVDARCWFNLAAAQGYKAAATRRELMEMTSNMIAEAQKLAALNRCKKAPHKRDDNRTCQVQ